MTMIESLPNLDNEYILTQEQLEQYRRDGHIYLQAVANTEEVEDYRTHIAAAIEEYAHERGITPGEEGYRRYFIQMTNLHQKHEAVKRLVFAKRFAKLAADLMGVPAVRLYHDQALFKEPGGKPTPWHQDQHYWPLDTDKTITMWMPLVDVSPEMGSMSFACGSQFEGYRGDFPISSEAHDYFTQLIADKGYRVARYDLKAGDATFHSGLVLHSAEGNHGNRMREVMTIIYYPDGTRLMEPDNRNRAEDMAVFHPGQKPGEFAASPLNPVLYP